MSGKRGTSRTYRCPDDHKHGKTGTCFNQHGCGCYPCVESRRVYQAGRYKGLAYGTWNPNRIVDGLGTRRRLQALAYMGWTGGLIAAELGVVQSYATLLLRADRVEQETADRVAGIYKRLWDKEPPGGRRKYTTNMARRNGWHGPLACDDIDNDPEPVTAERDPRRAGWVLDEIEWLRHAGESPVAVQVALGRTRKSMAKLAYRHDRPDIAAWIDPRAKDAA